MSETKANSILIQIADTIVADLRGTIEDRKFAPRIWTRDGLDHVRVYTGSGDEHLRVYLTRVERSRSRMAWGSEIDHVLSEAGISRSLIHCDQTVI